MVPDLKRPRGCEFIRKEMKDTPGGAPGRRGARPQAPSCPAGDRGRQRSCTGGVRRVRFVPVLKGRPGSLPSAHSFSKHVPSQAHVLFASQDTSST